MRLVDQLGKMLTGFGCDRWVHLVMCLVVSWLGATAVDVVVSQHAERAVVGLAGGAGGVLVAIGKEVYDKMTTGLFDEGDLAADFVGVALFYVVYCV